MSEPFRLLVTGSRDWTDATRVWGALTALAAQVDSLVVVHGAAGRGVDMMAHRWVARQQASGRADISEEPHPADWEAPCRPECRLGHRRPQRDGGGSYCPAAGDYRNQEMVETGPHACFAWVAPCSRRGCRNRKPHGSHGASDCADRAEEAGINTRRWYDESMVAVL
jgi:hypothetical protein